MVHALTIKKKDDLQLLQSNILTEDSETGIETQGGHYKHILLKQRRGVAEPKSKNNT